MSVQKIKISAIRRNFHLIFNDRLLSSIVAFARNSSFRSTFMFNRYEDEFVRIQQQQQQQQQHQHELHLQMQHQALQQARAASHSVTSMLSWPPASQPHDYHPGMSPMGPMDSVSPIQEQQNQFMRGQPQQQQHPQQPQQLIPPVEPPRHPSSPIITSTQPMSGHPIAAGLLGQQNPKPPPVGNQSWKSNEARRPKTYNCTACNKWFTSSGHLKRHYNTTLHKNAVKQSNQPDPANMPISVHHHPGRDPIPGRGAASVSRNSPELSSSSSSPPNLMAGPSGEATRGLLHTPTSTTTIFSSNSNNNTSNSNEATAVQTPMDQKVMQQQQQQTSTVMLSSNLVFLGVSPSSSPMGQVQHLPQQQQQQHHLLHHHQQQQQQHHPQQMGSPSPQLGQQSHHLMGSPSPIGLTSSVHHPMSSPMSPMQQQHLGHMNSPSPMASVHQQQQQHHHHHHQQQHHHHISNSPSPIMGSGVVSGAAMASPPPVTMMGGTTMPHQPYPNALPPHVTTITSIPGLLESITSQLTTTGNNGGHDMQQQHHLNHHQHHQLMPSTVGTPSIQQEMQLPGFGTFSNHHHHHHQQQPKLLPSFTQFGIANGFMVHGQSPPPHQAINVGGLSPEENLTPSDRQFESPVSSYEIHHHRSTPSPHYECISGLEIVHHQTTTDGPIVVSSYGDLPVRHSQLPQPQLHEQEVGSSQEQTVVSSDQLQKQLTQRETNNNLPKLIPKKRQLASSTGTTKRSNAKSKKANVNNNSNNNNNNNNNNINSSETNSVVTKEHQVTSTNTGSHYISQNGLHMCIECDKVFNKACYLTQHNKSFHSGDKPFKCNQCGKRFPHEFLHAEHLQKHAGEKPYKCEICPKQFNHKTDLRRHMCLHTGEKPYACDNCGKGFIRKDHMMKHLETHKKKSNHKVHLKT